MIKPNKLKRNDKVAIVAPSMSAKEENVNKAIKTVRQMGLNPVVYKSCYLINDKEQVDAQQRANDIMEAFQDDKIKGLISLRAGYGTLEVLDFLDYDVIRKNPKVFMGFSDITAMHLALNKYSDLITFHGPLATSNIRVKGKNGTEIDPYTRYYLESALFSEKPMGIIKNPVDEPIVVFNEGKAKGQLLGGNLTLLQQTLGTKYEIDAKGKILFIEDFGESVESIQNMLKQLEVAGKLDDCAGMLVGTWVKCAEEYPEAERTAILNEKISEILVPHGKPILSNIRSGHNVPMLVFPEGIETEIDTKEKKIDFTEPATISMNISQDMEI